jgi:hypothetical protein
MARTTLLTIFTSQPPALQHWHHPQLSKQQSFKKLCNLCDKTNVITAAKN